MTQLPPRVMIAVTQAEKAEAIALARAAGFKIFRSGSNSQLREFVMLCIREHGKRLAAKAARKATK